MITLLRLSSQTLVVDSPLLPDAPQEAYKRRSDVEVFVRSGSVPRLAESCLKAHESSAR